MLAKTDQKVLAAFARLANDQDFLIVKEWLEASRNDLYARTSRTRDDVLVRWYQGMAQAIEDVLDHAESAQATLRKSR